MFYTQITVDIPKKKRIKSNSISGSKYVFEILQRKGKNYDSEKSTCVGQFISDGKMHPNERYYELHPEMRNETTIDNPLKFASQVHIGAVTILNKIALDLGLTNMLKKHFAGYDELIMNLLCYYLIRECSKSQLFKFYQYEHYTKLNYIPSESTLSNLFSKSISRESINAFLQEWLNTSISRNKCVIDIDFDSTNFNVNSNGVNFAERGHPKIDEGLPQVNVAYFIDRETSLPMFYDLFYGSIIDMNHCKTAVEKIHCINENAKISFIMDRGYFSKSNIEYIENNNFHFMCMGKDCGILNQLIDQYDSSIYKAENRVMGSIYGIKLKGEAFSTSNKKYNIYLYFDSEKRVELLPAMQNSIELSAERIIGKNDKNGHISNTYGKVIDIEIKDDIIISAKPNYSYIDDYGKRCGYFWIISNEDLSLIEVLQSYRHRDVIEKTFRIIKSSTDFDKLYARSDDVYEAKTFMGFLSAILRTSLLSSMREFFTERQNETSETVLLEADKICAEYLKDRYVLRYSLTQKQRQIISFFGLRQIDIEKAVQELNVTQNLMKL